MKLSFAISLFVFLFWVSRANAINKKIFSPQKMVSGPADVRIAALIPANILARNQTKCTINHPRYSYIRTRDGTTKCYELNHSGVMWSETLRFVVEASNEHFFKDKGVVGYDIRDSINNVDVALDAAVDFVTRRRRTSVTGNESMINCTCSVNETEPYVIALVGGARSEISQRVNTVVGVTSLPQISYSSTSVSLNDKSIYRTFLRTIPPDNYQAKVMADMAKKFGWRYVATVATDEDYGRRGVEIFHEEARKYNICISMQRLFHFNVTSDLGKRQIREIVGELKADKKANVVVLFCERPRAKAFLAEAEAQRLTGKTWIATEAWGFSESVYEFDLSVVGGVLGVVTNAPPLQLFENHLAALNPSTASHNPWLMQYFREKLCAAGNSNCQLKPTLNASILSRHKASYVMDAVYTIFLGILKECGNITSTRKQCLRNIDLEKLRKHMLATNTEGAGKTTISFDKDGNPGVSYYRISNLQPDPTAKYGKRFVHVGTWTNYSLEIKKSIYWNGGKNDTPLSQCSFPCPPGHYYVRGDVSCCWKCVLCPPGKFKVGTGNRMCESCPKGYMSDTNRTLCQRIPEEFIRWDSVTSAILVSLSVLGVLVTCFMFGVYFKYRETPIVKAASRYPSLFLLVSIALMFILPLLYIGRPNVARCHAQPIAFGLLMTLASSLVLTKTFRLIQIFNNVTANLRDKPLVTVKTQFLMVVVFIVLEVIIIAVFLDRRPIKINTVVQDAAVPINCGSSARNLHTAVLLYNGVLAIICAGMAFRARSLPANFSEARLISFAMFTFSVIWISFLIVFSGSIINEYSTYICVAIIATALDLLVCMFGPKIFVILFRPELNEMHVVRADIYRYTLKQRARSHTPNLESSESELTRTRADTQTVTAIPRKPAISFLESKL